MNETARTLCHEWSKAKKAAYNRDYYQKHKEYWRALAESNKRMDSSFGETSRIRNSLKKSGKQMSTADAYQYWKKHKENHDAYKDSSTLREADDIMRRGYDKNAEQEQLKKMRQYGYSVRKTGTPRFRSITRQSRSSTLLKTIVKRSREQTKLSTLVQKQAQKPQMHLILLMLAEKRSGA